MKKVVWALVLTLVCFGAVAQEQKKMSAEEQAAMAVWMKFMTPSDGHKLLEGWAGKWDAKITMWMAPGAPPSVSTGSSENRWIMDGRIIEERFTGTFEGMPFTGLGYTGYDNVKKEYWGTWMDNMGTGVMRSTGSTSDGGKSWKFTSTSTDPMAGKEVPGESVVTVTDKDHHTMEMWGPAPDGKMFKMMEVAYSRKK